MHPVHEPVPPFELAVKRVDSDRSVLSASGELDFAAAAPLRDLLRISRDNGRNRVRLDLSGVTLLDCSCLGVLVWARHALVASYGELTLAPISAPVARLIQLTRLDRILLSPGELDSTGTRGPAAQRPPQVPLLRAVSDSGSCAVKHARVIELEQYRSTRKGSR